MLTALIILTAHAEDWITLETAPVGGWVQVTVPSAGTLKVSYLARGVDCNGCTCAIEVYPTLTERTVTFSLTPTPAPPASAETPSLDSLLWVAEPITQPCRRMPTVRASALIAVPEAGVWLLPDEADLSVRFTAEPVDEETALPLTPRPPQGSR